MANWEDVAQVALSLPKSAEGTSFGNRAWKVNGKTFVWARPLRKSELDKLRSASPRGKILAVHTDDLEMKEAMLASGEPAFFTISHFDGYAAVLVLIEKISKSRLQAIIEDAWLSQASPKLVATFLLEKKSSDEAGRRS